MTLVARYGAHTDVGLHRPGNEDSYDVRPGLFIVADGMGGAQAGEIASELAVHTVVTMAEAGDPLGDAAIAANTAIHDAAAADPDLKGMGTTLTVFRLCGDELEFAHVGDSRAYLLRAGELSRLTQDHSLVSQWLREGTITTDEAARSRYRNVLTRALGTEPQVEVDTFTVPVASGDVLMLCSDGLHGLVPDERLAAILTSDDDPAACARSLVKEAKREGGFDNITAVVIRLETAAGDDPAGAADAATTDAATTADLPAGHPAGVQGAGPEVATRPAAGGEGGAVTAAGRRRPALAIVALVIVGLLLLALVAGVLVASQSYFVGVDEGNVAVYRGLPYAPAGVELYRLHLRSTVPLGAVPYDLQAKVTARSVTGKAAALRLLKEAGGTP